MTTNGDIEMEWKTNKYWDEDNRVGDYSCSEKPISFLDHKYWDEDIGMECDNQCFENLIGHWTCVEALVYGSMVQSWLNQCWLT
jgi:hypothetical protein